MSQERDLAGELAAQNGISEEALQKIRREQARSAVLAVKRRAARVRFIAIAAWAVTVIVIFASMWMAVAVLFGFEDIGPPPVQAPQRPVLMALTMLSGLGMMAFVVAVVASVAWYFSARTASLTAIDARLSELEAILRAEAEAAGRHSGNTAGESHRET
jgi:hypothetical protein